jgi:cold shock protein
MPTGRVKTFDASHQYGFLQPSDGTDDVFVHASAVEGEDGLHPGDLVEYEIAEDEGAPKAGKVRVAQRAREGNPVGRMLGAPPTWDEIEDIEREHRQQRRRRRR